MLSPHPALTPISALTNAISSSHRTLKLPQMRCLHVSANHHYGHCGHPLPSRFHPIHTKLPLALLIIETLSSSLGVAIRPVFLPHFATVSRYVRSGKNTAMGIPAKFAVKRVYPTKIRRAGGFEWRRYHSSGGGSHRDYFNVFLLLAGEEIVWRP